MSADHAELTLSPMRKAIASRMVEAKQTIPHFRLQADFAVDELLSARRALIDDSGEKISLNDVILKACAAALMQVPEINLQWTHDAVLQFKHADIALVVANARGLFTPIINRAEQMGIVDIARESSRLIARAGSGTLKLDEMSGGSFSISNLGMFGVEAFDAIINPPQCAMLAIGCTRRELSIDSADNPVVVTKIHGTLSVDHRAVDGTTAARFLMALRTFIEQPDWLL